LPLLVAFALLSGCTASEEAPPPAGRLGWLDGRCLVTSDAALPAGTRVAVITLGTEQGLAEASVVGPATSGEACVSLSGERQGTVQAEEGLLYEVTDWSSGSATLGIAWIGEPVTIAVTDGRASSDLDADGVDEFFTVCSSSEGLHFGVWRGAPFSGSAVWSGYYYLGYDLEPDCPPGSLPG
jgi:hypothetical protein